MIVMYLLLIMMAAVAVSWWGKDLQEWWISNTASRRLKTVMDDRNKIKRERMMLDIQNADLTVIIQCKDNQIAAQDLLIKELEAQNENLIGKLNDQMIVS